MNSQPDWSTLSDLFQSFLQNLQEEINSISLEQNRGKNLDEYILELNSFYYRDFLRRFYPAFKTELEELLNQAYLIHNNEESMRRQLLEHLKQLALYSNALEQAICMIGQQKELITYEQQHCLLGRQRILVELLYSMKDLQHKLQKYQKDFSYLVQLIADDQFLGSIRSYPYMVYYLILLFKNSKNSQRTLRRWMTDLQLCINLLVTIQEDHSMNDQQIENIITEINGLSNQNLARSKENFTVINPISSIYHRLLNSQLYARQYRDMRQTAHQYESFLSQVLYLLNQCIEADSDYQLDLLGDASRILEISPDPLGPLEEIVKNTGEELQNLITDLEASIHAQYTNYRIELQKLIDPFLHQWRPDDQQWLAAMPTMYTQLQEIYQSCLHINEQMQWWDEMEEAGQQYEQLLKHGIKTLEQMEQALAQNQATIGKVLGPRNLNRKYDGFQIKIDSWKPEAGKKITTKMQDALSQSLVKYAASPQPYGTVLSTEGSFYRIEVDQQEYLVVPKLVLSSGKQKMKLCILIEEKKSLIRCYSDQHENMVRYTSIEAHEVFPSWQTLSVDAICHQESLITQLREYIRQIATPILPLPDNVEWIIVAVPALLPAWMRQSLQQTLYDLFSCWNVLIYPLALFIPHRLEPGLSTLQNKLLIQSVSAGYHVSLLSILGDGALCLEKQQHCDTLHKIRSWDRKYPITEVFFLNPSASDRSGLDSSRDDRLHFIHSEELLPSMPEVLSGPKPAVLYPFLPVLQSKHPSSGQSEQIPLTFDRYNLEFRVNGRYCLHLVELKQQHSYQLFELDHRHRQIPLITMATAGR